jgi:signal transduction histidine kinase
LASSIAHDINNPLEAVTNLIYLARNEAVPPSVAHYLDLAQQELRRITHITIETLRFHRQASQPVRSEIVEIVESVLLLHEGRLRAAQIETLRRFREHPTILCIPNEIRQVVANLIGNAVDAMIKNTGPRTLAIRVHRACDPRTNVPGVRVLVADSGSGIPAASREHLFEPFFTTKETTGTGLGLWVSDEIVRRHNGVLRFRSRDADPHRGTAFSLFLREETTLETRETREDRP